MKKVFQLLLLIIVIKVPVNGQNLDLGQKIEKVPNTFKLIGISSKDNSKIYRFIETFPTTVFSYSVDYFEVKIHENTVVSLHFVLRPKDKLNEVPIDLIEKIKLKSGHEPLKKDSKYFFDDISNKTVVARQNIPDYNGDKIHILVSLTDYLKN